MRNYRSFTIPKLNSRTLKMYHSSFKFPDISLNKSISIVSGNTKLLNISNTSMPPIITCNPSAPCTVKGCYILDHMYWPSQKRAYMKNYNLYTSSPLRYYDQLDLFLSLVQPLFFRYLVAGDIPDLTYLILMNTLAAEHPKTTFCCYTKKYGLLSAFLSYNREPNLILFASAWPNFPIPSAIIENYRIAWMQDGTETRIKSSVFTCTGHCSTCKFCYNPKFTKDVLFYKH